MDFRFFSKIFAIDLMSEWGAMGNLDLDRLENFICLKT